MRTAGILMPITSLPSPYGVGTLGQCARDFIQFLHRAGQTYWQIRWRETATGFKADSIIGRYFSS